MRIQLRRTLRNSLTHIVLGAVALGLAALAAAPVNASVVAALDLEELVKAADDIVVARALTKQSLFDEFGRIVTDVELEVETAQKGSCVTGEHVVVRRLGGVVNGLGMKVAGTPHFTVGERSVVFANREQGRDFMRPVGMSQGVLPVAVRAGTAWVLPGVRDLVAMKRDAQGVLRAAPTALLAERRLAGLLTDIRKLVAGARQ